MALSSTPTTSQRCMYLSFDQWSPRFDSTFYSFKVSSKSLQSSAPLPEGNSTIGGNTNHPAWYYSIQVFSEHRSHTVHRRYSQFRWLYDEIRTHPPENGSNSSIVNKFSESFPQKTCPFHVQTDAFAQTRMKLLQDFLIETLQNPGYSAHPAIIQFLELDRFDLPDNEKS